jgi:hypothetical protein
VKWRVRVCVCACLAQMTTAVIAQSKLDQPRIKWLEVCFYCSCVSVVVFDVGTCDLITSMVCVCAYVYA